MTENLFVLGNGESRKDIDVELLKTKGKVWGCNALYREHKVDGLIAVDPMLQHEIYRSGYVDENKVARKIIVYSCLSGCCNQRDLASFFKGRLDHG
jgi:hypothetical protein